MTGIVIRPVAAADEGRWAQLFAAYRLFYALEPDADVVARVWGWVNDPGHEVHGLVAELDGRVAGIAHYRVFARPSSGTVGLWLDDLFTDPAVRGHGVGRALLDHLRQLAADRRLSVVRWITADDNARARALYDTVGTATRWVTYDARPGSLGQERD